MRNVYRGSIPRVHLSQGGGLEFKDQLSFIQVSRPAVPAVVVPHMKQGFFESVLDYIFRI
jgi:chemotaxis response regulator CheB